MVVFAIRKMMAATFYYDQRVTSTTARILHRQPRLSSFSWWKCGATVSAVSVLVVSTESHG